MTGPERSTDPEREGGTGMAAEPGLAELGAQAAARRTAYGEDALIVCDRLVRIYTAEGVEVQALQGLDLLVDDGELTAIVGASGSGKSTLVNILAGLDKPTAGSARVAGCDLAAMGDRERLAYRRAVVGFIWQDTSRNLLPYLTAQQNVMVPMLLARRGRTERRRQAAGLLEALSVAHCADRKPGEMSGGEQQRTAIATALANRPRLLLADEPTGELDTATAADVFGALQAANTELGVTVLLVTHDPAVSGQVRRVISIRDGRTSTETLRHDAADEHGNVARHAVEYAVLDRAGRLQLPREMTEPLGMRGRVRLEAQPGHIGVWPDSPPQHAEAGNPGGAPEASGETES
jgi:ABC-type lipoprotein export system ATPase subunit